MAEYSPDKVERAEGKLREFRKWRNNNPSAWSWAERFALDAVAAGQHVGGSTIVEAVRNHDFSDRYGRPTRTNNDYAPVIARLLLQAHPELQGHIELRGSVFDVILGVARNG